jgi:hypothetical protein
MTDRNNIGIGIDPQTHGRLKRLARKRDVSIRRLIRDLSLEESQRIKAGQ